MGFGGERQSEEYSRVDFEWSYTEEPHATRREQILKAHPEVKELYGPCPWTKYKVALAVGVQIAMCYFVRDMSFLPWLLCTYALSGTINHSMTLAMHEISHNLAFKRVILNRYFGMVANLPLGIPASASFTRYHMEHHKYQGEDFIDTDIPTEWEGRFFTTTLRKLLWMVMQPLFYAFRPMMVAPKVPRGWELLNLSAQVAFDAAIYYFFGLQALLYLIVGTLLGMGVHPMAGHFVAEHYTFVKGQETYSYYGPLNWVSFNVGYHNEHHDFPYIPGSRLPKLREIAHEFYDTMPHHNSWTKVVWKYITDPTMGPFNRVKRHTITPEVLQRLNPSAAGAGKAKSE